MKNGSTSPVLHSSRSRHHKRKFSLECTSGKPLCKSKCLVANKITKEEGIQNLKSFEIGLCMLQTQTLQEGTSTSEMEKSIPNLECPASASSNLTPQKRKKQKCSLTPHLQDGKSLCEEASDESSYSAALDDSLMTCNIDCILDSLEVKGKNDDMTEPHSLNEKTARTLGSYVSKKSEAIGKHACSIDVIPQVEKNAEKYPLTKLTNASHPLRKNSTLNETYTSPNRFQIKVRRKLATETEKYYSSCKSSTDIAVSAATLQNPDPRCSEKFRVNSKQHSSKQAIVQQTRNTNSLPKPNLQEPLNCAKVLHSEKFSSLDNISTILQDPTLMEAFNESFNIDDNTHKKHSNLPGCCSPDIFADLELSSPGSVDCNTQSKDHNSKFHASNIEKSSNIPIQGKTPFSEIAAVSASKNESLNTVVKRVASDDKAASEKKCQIFESKENISHNKPMIHDTIGSKSKNPGAVPNFLPAEKPLAIKMPKKKQEAKISVHSPTFLKDTNSTLSTNPEASHCKIFPESDSSRKLNVTQKKSLPGIDSSSAIKSSPEENNPKIQDETQVTLPAGPTNSKLWSTSDIKSTKSSISKTSNVFESKSSSNPNSANVRNAPEMKSQPKRSKGHDVSSEAKSPGSNCSMVSTSASDCSTLQSQNLLQKMRGKLYPDTQGTSGSAHTTQLSTSMNTSGVLRSAAVTAAVQLVHKAAAPDAAVGHELGPFFGLPSTVLELLHKHRGITGLYDWQSECINQGLSGNNLLVSLPTSGGKTLVAEVLMLRTLLVRKKHAIFLLPYVAIVQEKVRGLAPLAVDLDFLLEEYAGSRGSYPPKKRTRKSVAFVATTEKASGLISSFLEEGRAGEVGLVVVDEAHMLGESGGRGALLEGAITKLRHCAKHVQIVAMSATISNLGQLSEFLGAELYTGDFRPVKLKQYVKMNDMVSEINPAALTDEELLFNHRSVDYGYSSRERARDQDGIAGLAREIIPQHSVLVFCPTRRNCESVATLLCTMLPSHLTQHNRPHKEALYKALAKEGGGSVCPVLRQVLPYGLAYHHSGLTEGERKLIEEGYLSGTLCLITCTSTLAAGVNLPARRVILRSPYTGRDPLTRSRYMQMVGRAGRAGLDSEGESFLIMQEKDARMIPDLVRGPVETCLSRLCDAADEVTVPYSHATARPPPLAYSRRLASSQGAAAALAGAPAAGTSRDSAPASGTPTAGTSAPSTPAGGGNPIETTLTSSCGLRDLVFSSIGLGLVSNLAQALELVQCSLMALQAPQRKLNLRATVVDVLERLRSFGMLRIKDSAASSPALNGDSLSSASGTGVSNSGRRLSGALSADASQSSTCHSLSSPGSSGAVDFPLEDLRDPCSRVRTPLLPHHTLVVSRLGRAAIKGCVELSIASRLYEDLMVARNSLAVHSRLHLLYLVTPYSAAHELPLVPQAFYQAYCGLQRDEMQAAELIGVSEAVAAKVAMGKTKAITDEVVKRFNAAIILHRLLAGEDVWKVSDKFEVPRGLLQRTLAAAAAFASCVHHFCLELEELWAFRDLLVSFSRQLSGCCSAHLLPLMDLPAVKLGRARLLYDAGYTNLHDVANANPADLVKAVHHLPRGIAVQMVHSAKALLLEKAEALQEEAEQVLLGLVHFSSGPRRAESTPSRL